MIIAIAILHWFVMSVLGLLLFGMILSALALRSYFKFSHSASFQSGAESPGGLTMPPMPAARGQISLADRR